MSKLWAILSVMVSSEATTYLFVSWQSGTCEKGRLHVRRPFKEVDGRTDGRMDGLPTSAPSFLRSAALSFAFISPPALHVVAVLCRSLLSLLRSCKKKHNTRQQLKLALPREISNMFRSKCLSFFIVSCNFCQAVMEYEISFW